MADPLRSHALAEPDRPAVIMAETGHIVTYAELDERANRVARLVQAHGLQTGDGIAILLDNEARYVELMWGAVRAGLYYTPVSTRLQLDEAAYIVRDCGAKIVFLAGGPAGLREELLGSGVEVIGIDGAGGPDYEELLAGIEGYAELPPTPPGKDFFYSSGTTGRPKGVRHPIGAANSGGTALTSWTAVFGLGPDTRFLSPGPLYHAAPLRFVMATTAVGGTAVVMSRFDAEGALWAIERHRVTHSQWVPTMLFRLLRMPQELRAAPDLSSHRCAIHAAAPCPADLKRQLIDWWGPIVWEYYSGTEGSGVTCLSSEEWLAHPGSVGHAVLGTLHILDDEGRELPPGETGQVYFDGLTFEYHGDPAKTAASRTPHGWSTLGDVGWVDEDGYLYLADRQAHVIIAGGVNIYPAEIENVLALHPAVDDVAVIGVPNAEYGEEVKAVVVLRDPAAAEPDRAAELIAHCRARLAPYECPRSIDFIDALPRLDTGKLQKHLLRTRDATGSHR